MLKKSFEDYVAEISDNADELDTDIADGDEDTLEDDDVDNEEDTLQDDEEDDEPVLDGDEVPELEGEYDDAAKALWERQWKGIRKREKQIAGKQELITKFSGQEKRFDALASLEEAILDPTQVEKVLPEFAAFVAKHHGLSIEKLFGVKPAATDPPAEDDEEIFDEDKRLLEIAERRLMAKLGPRLAKLDQLEAAEQTRGQTSQFERFIEDNHRPTRLKLKKELGIEFSKAQFTEAIKANPELARDPVKAMKIHHLSLIEKELAKRTSRNAPRGPELTRQSERIGKSPKKPREMNFHDFLEEIA